MADVLNEDQIGEIIDAFNAVDADHDGIIQASALGGVLKLLGENPTDADLQAGRKPNCNSREATLKRHFKNTPAVVHGSTYCIILTCTIIVSTYF